MISIKQVKSLTAALARAKIAPGLIQVIGDAARKRFADDEETGGEETAGEKAGVVLANRGGLVTAARERSMAEVGQIESAPWHGRGQP